MTGQPPLHVVGVGPWGAEVGRQLVDRTAGATLGLLGLDASPAALDLPPARVRVLAASRPVPGLAAVVDDEAHASSTPWLLVALAHPDLQIGPVVVPGHGACFGCWQRRLRQHAADPDADAALERHLLDHPDVSLAGYPPPSAALAAGLAARIADRLAESPEPEAGRLRLLNLVTLRMRSGRGVGVHACRRCGLGRCEPERSFVRLRAAMEEALGWAA
jgi:bacteriocin biosynthesis cyclodehydratase domain-containing protein